MDNRPTPETDALRSRIPDPRAIQDMIASHGDIERKLAEAREIIAELQAGFDQEGNTAAEACCVRTKQEIILQRDAWKSSHDHVCQELAKCEEARDENARMVDEARKQRDMLAEALQKILFYHPPDGYGMQNIAAQALAAVKGEQP